MQFDSLQAIQENLTEGHLSVKKLVIHYLTKIHQSKDLNIYVEIFEKEALQRAEELDEKFKTNPKSVGRLYGAVISLKDVICYQDHQVTAGSKILEGFTSLYSATCVEKLLAEDAVIIGRVNCDEFAMGSSNETSIYGATKNPLDSEKIPGGSSGASAAAVAANTCLVSIGSDTGGSVRQPAAFCGIVGMKPTYGRISRHGLIAYASSFDQIGVLSKTVEDAGLVLEIMSGADEFDSTVAQLLESNFSIKKENGKKYKIAYLADAVEHEGIHPEIQKTIKEEIEALKEAGHEVAPVNFPLLEYIVPTYYVLTTAEASSNLSRFDGIRYGYRSPNAQTLEEVYKKSRTEGFGKEVKRRIMLGTFVLSAGYYDAYFSKAQKVRRLIKEEIEKIFENYDFILTPTTPDFAWKIGEKSDDPVSVYLSDIFTVTANLTGMPCISLPLAGKTNPVGLQLMSNKFEEQKLLEFAATI